MMGGRGVHKEEQEGRDCRTGLSARRGVGGGGLSEDTS